VLVFAVDYAVAGRLAWTPGGFALSFGRMLQDGIVKKYLDQHCPDPKLRLCAVKDRIPQDADTWFWGSDLFDQMGRFAGLGREMKTIALDSLAEYPGLQVKTAAIAIGELAAAVVLTLIGNAFICGALSNPHDRYGARVVWLAVLVVIVAAIQVADSLGRSSSLS
jgi:hypothetical protein